MTLFGALDALQARPLARARGRGRSRPRRRRGTTRRARPRGRRAPRAGRSRRGRSCPPCRRTRSRARPSIAASSAVERQRAGARRWGRRSRPRCRARAARPSGGCCRGCAADATIRQSLGGTPSRRTFSPARSRASSSPSRFEAVPPIVITPEPSAAEPVLARQPAHERVLDVGRGRRGVEGVHRLVGDADGELGRGGGDQRRGVQVRDRARVAEPDPAVQDRRERPPAPARAGRPRAGTGRARRRRPCSCSVVSGERGPGRRGARASASTTAFAAARSASWERGSAVTNSMRRILSAPIGLSHRRRCADRPAAYVSSAPTSLALARCCSPRRRRARRPAATPARRHASPGRASSPPASPSTASRRASWCAAAARSCCAPTSGACARRPGARARERDRQPLLGHLRHRRRQAPGAQRRRHARGPALRGGRAARAGRRRRRRRLQLSGFASQAVRYRPATARAAGCSG